jgi:hypothetical protein
MKRLLPALLMCVCLTLAIPAAASVTVGLPADQNSGNCLPFGCGSDPSVTFSEYQQVYTSSQFSGPITITNLEFFNTQFNNHATTMNSGNWAISLSTTSADWNTLSFTLSSNIGTDNTLVFNGDLYQPWAFGDTLVINLTTPFTYNPSNGNLLMDMNVSNISAPNGQIFFDASELSADQSTIIGTIMGRAINLDATGVDINSGYGLVTEFSTSTAVPEPATMLLLGLGLVGLAGVRRFKQ